MNFPLTQFPGSVVGEENGAQERSARSPKEAVMEDLFDLFEEQASSRRGSRKRPRSLAGYALKEAMGQDSMGDYSQNWGDVDHHLAMSDDFEFGTRGTGETDNTEDAEGPKEE